MKYIAIFLIVFLMVCSIGLATTKGEKITATNLEDVPSVKSVIENGDYMLVRLDIGKPCISSERDAALYIKKCLVFIRDDDKYNGINVIDFEVKSQGKDESGNSVSVKSVMATFKKAKTDKINYDELPTDRIYTVADDSWSRW